MFSRAIVSNFAYLFSSFNIVYIISSVYYSFPIRVLIFRDRVSSLPESTTPWAAILLWQSSKIFYR